MDIEERHQRMELGCYAMKNLNCEAIQMMTI